MIRTTLTSAMSSWMVVAVAALYLGLLAVLVCLPGPALLDRLRWLDSGICAQLAAHSFYPGGERLPLCARNTGIYLGFLVTFISLHAIKRGRAQQLPRWPMVVVLVSGIVVLAIDGFNSFFVDLGLPHLYQPQNVLRLATGLATGLALATLTLPVLNRQLWCEYNEKRSISSWKEYAFLVAALIVCFFAVAPQSGVLLYPIALLSTAGLLTVVSSVNLIVLVAISKRDESFTSYRELLPFFGLALLLAIGEMLALAQLKLMLMGTLAL
ncbi:MAG TPA: DUF2085 domain-containing protein [Ktedonobacteraceae bacterium]|nr:DUF2085 domain-containing protein [Ktedonobacteraceae bacterium]